jgi:tRNA(Ile2)-agmatinylcytidine synthase
MRYLLGIDDTDSRLGRCTTHLGYLVACQLARMGCAFSTYPRLVRLNPNVPFKTRGNAAVCIEFEADPAESEAAFRAVTSIFRREADVKNGANSALVMISGGSVEGLTYARQLYERAVRGMVNHVSVLAAMRRMEVRFELLGNGMGVVGALASIGFDESRDHTYELIAYRRPENCGTKRVVEPTSVLEMERATFPHTFNSYDHESGRVLIAPTGPDPVLLGVRGDSPRSVLEAFRRIRTEEEPLGYMVYATNQCTDGHLTERLSIPLKAYSAGWLTGEVVFVSPSRGGHLLLRLRVGSSIASCMVYEPSGDLLRVARLLRQGDSVRVSGGVRRASTKNPAVVNVEKIEVVSIHHEGVKINPKCVFCNSRMKSEGKGKGYQCEDCGRKRVEREKMRHPGPSPARIPRGTYLPSPRAQRHLTKQLIRYGAESSRRHALVQDWIVSPAMELEIA